MIPSLLKESVVRWSIFMTLMFTVPALLFLVMAVMFMPAVFFFAGILYVIPKLIAGNVGESLSFIVILGLHALVYSLLYLLLAWVIAKLICLARTTIVRGGLLILLVGGLCAMTRMPIYGSGGHGPMHWTNLPGFVAEIQRDYGTEAPYLVYGAAACFVFGVLALRRWRSQRGARAE